MVSKNVINEALPVHRIEDQLEAMSGFSGFAALNLTKDYHQMCLTMKPREITAFFFLIKGLLQWKLFPMRMKASIAVFQRLID